VHRLLLYKQRWALSLTLGEGKKKEEKSISNVSAFPPLAEGKTCMLEAQKSEKENSIPFIFHLRARELPIEQQSGVERSIKEEDGERAQENIPSCYC
jgi:hypothetical protein